MLLKILLTILLAVAFVASAPIVDDSEENDDFAIESNGSIFQLAGKRARQKLRAARRRYLSCANSCTEKRKLLPCYKGCDKLFPFPNKPKIKIPDIAYGGGGGGIPGVTLPNLGELTLPTLPTLPVTVPI